MKRQLFLFEEFEDPVFSLINEKGVDITDLATPNYISQIKGIPNNARQKKTNKALALKSFPKEKFIIFPTGGEHPSPLPRYKDKIFPFVYNLHSNKPVAIRMSRCVYPSMSFPTPDSLKLNEGPYQNTKNIDFMVHDLFTLAFMDNTNPDIYWMTDHKDEDKWNYELSNLELISAERNQEKASRHLKGKTREEAKRLGAGTVFNTGEHVGGQEQEETCDYTI